MGHRDDLLVTRQYTRMTNPAGGPPTRSVCLLGFVQVGLATVMGRVVATWPSHAQRGNWRFKKWQKRRSGNFEIPRAIVPCPPGEVPGMFSARPSPSRAKPPEAH